MKHSLAALVLAVALLCTLLTGCGGPLPPEGPDGSNGTPPSGDNSTQEPDDNGGSISAPKLQPTIQVESATFNATQKGCVAGYVFQVTNPNQAYSLSSVKLTVTMADAAGKTKTETTSISSIAPGDTIRFAQTWTYPDWRPTQNVSCKVEVWPSSYKGPETEADGTPKMAKYKDLQVVSVRENKNNKIDYNTFEGVVRNTSRYACKARISLLLKKNGSVVSAAFVPADKSIPAGGSYSFVIYQTKDISYDSYEVIAAPW